MQGEREHVVATIGVFDGVHRGHRALLDAVTAAARETAAVSAAVTFDPPPESILKARSEPFQLTPWPMKQALLAAAGIERVVLLRFSRALAGLSPEDFVQDELLCEFEIEGLVVGYDFRFGAGGKGNSSSLRALGVRFGFWVREIEALSIHGDPVSSTRIRDALGRGAVEEAREMLGRPFAVEGEVVAGHGLGTRLNAPTANVAPHPEQMMPRPGVYLVQARWGERTHGGVAHVGSSPTLGRGDKRLVEVHLIGFSGDLRGERLGVDFLRWRRAPERFAGVHALQTAIAQDVRWATEQLAGGA